MTDHERQPGPADDAPVTATAVRTKWIYFRPWYALFYLVLVATAFLLSSLVPSLSSARQEAGVVKCTAHLRAIGYALEAYASQHAGAYPPTLDPLLTDGYLADPAFLSCPASESPYTYIRGQTQKTDPPDVLAYEALGNHPGRAGGNVLLAGEDVEFLDPVDHGVVIRRAHENLTSLATRPATWPYNPRWQTRVARAGAPVQARDPTQ